MENPFYTTGPYSGRNEESAIEPAGARSIFQRDFEPAVDDVSFMAHRIYNHLSERLSAAMRLKRIFDIVAASVALVVLSPIFALAALMIKIETGGNVFFVQERIGLNRRRSGRRNSSRQVPHERRKRADRRKEIHAGRPFAIYKFRTMVEDAERFGPVLAQENDPRVTRVGRLFRKTRIDEIPQFINVLKGEMSIIGPRPERSFYIDQMRCEVPEFTARLTVKPGITGLAQVENGYTQTLERMKEKLFFDLKYITEISLFQEIKILFKTVSVVVTGKGAC